MDKRFSIIVGAILLGVVGFVVFGQKKAANTITASAPTNHVVGSNKYSVVLTEYGDFECPACGQYYPIVKQIKESYKDYIQFQFRNFPIDTIHKSARAAHRAAEAAGNQGKFFEMHNMLYENQANWKDNPNSAEIFSGYATQLKLDVTKFNADMLGTAVNATINADIAEGKKIPVDGTPTFALNGTKIENPRDIAGFKKLLDTAIKKQNPSFDPNSIL